MPMIPDPTSQLDYQSRRESLERAEREQDVRLLVPPARRYAMHEGLNTSILEMRKRFFDAYLPHLAGCSKQLATYAVAELDAAFESMLRSASEALLRGMGIKP